MGKNCASHQSVCQKAKDFGYWWQGPKPEKAKQKVKCKCVCPTVILGA